MKSFMSALLIMSFVVIFWCALFLSIIAHTQPVAEKARNQWLLKLAVMEMQESENGR